MRPFTRRERLRYAFDNTLSRGPSALVLWLGVLTAATVLLVSGLAYLAATEADREAFEHSLIRLVWIGALQTLGTGSMGDSGSLQYLVAMLALTFAGIFLLSALIGLITTAIDTRITELRKGRSRVVQTGHTVILGWSEHVFTFVSEIALANVNRRERCIAILAPRDKVEMEDALADHVPERHGTRLVCRTGSPMEPADLAIVNVGAARALLILSGAGEDPDAEVIKTLLALRHLPDRPASGLHVVAEVRDGANLVAARLASQGEAAVVAAGDLISRIIAQTVRQPGLSVVYSELLDFAGDEVYFHREPDLAGLTFGAALDRYATSSVIGLRRDGDAKLLPPLDTVLEAEDILIVIARDDGVTRRAPPGPVDPAALVDCPSAPAPARRTLILGWNWRGTAIINAMDRYVAPGSTVTVVADAEGMAGAVADDCQALARQSVACDRADTTDRRVLEALAPAGFEHIVVLCYSDSLPVDQADARTLVTLLHLRDLLEGAERRPTVVTEMLDLRNRRLAEVTRADDFIVSHQLVSLLMAQIAENRALEAVFADLFAVEGAEIYLKTAADYVLPGERVTFYTVLEAARRRHEIAIGYRHDALADDPAAGYGIVLNPDKARPFALDANDSVIVLAER